MSSMLAISGAETEHAVVETLLTEYVKHVRAEALAWLKQVSGEITAVAVARGSEERWSVSWTAGLPDDLCLQPSMLRDAATSAGPLVFEHPVGPDSPRSLIDISIPVVYGQRDCGLVFIRTSMGSVASASTHLDALTVLASQAAIAMETAERFALLSEEARNRRAADEALRISETRWRRMFKHSPLGVVVADVEGYIIDANPAFCAMLGYDDGMPRVTHFDLTFPEDMTTTRQRHENLISGAREVETRFEKRFRRRDGSAVWTTANVAVLPCEEGAPVNLLALVEDNTARRKAEQALQKAQYDLARVSRVTAMGELVASITHEVLQPLTAIKANSNACLHWMEREPPDVGEALAAMKRLARDASHAGDVVTRMRGFMKRGDAALARVDLSHLLGDVLRFVQGEISRRRIRLRADFSPDTPSVMGDAVQLQQVVLNLVLNAIEATAEQHARTPEIRIASSRLGEAEVIVTVRDNGVGIPASEIETIFEVFHTSKPDGMGMGLAISRSIVSAHDGRIWAESIPGEGASFSFVLPSVP